MAFQIDQSHSQIQFTVRHTMISKARGLFEKWSGTVNLDPENPARTAVEIVVDTASLSTKDGQRDAHLRSPDFFDVEKFPQMVFKSTNVEVNGEKAKLSGNLTIRDVTKPLVLAVDYEGSAKSPWGTTNYGFSGKGKINREDWGLTWNVALETGGWLVGKEIEIAIELELVQVAEATPELIRA